MSALDRLLRLAENLTPSGVIGDGMVAEFHHLAALVREEREGADFVAMVIEDPDRQLCCNGRDCGCEGATIGQYAAWAMKKN